MQVNKIIGHARELKENSMVEKWVIWGLGTVGIMLYQQVKAIGLRNVFLYDSDDSKMVESDKRIASWDLLKRELKSTKTIGVIIAILSEQVVDEIAGQLLNLGNQDNIYRYIPEKSADVRKRLLERGFDGGNGKKFFLVSDLEGKQVIEQKILSGVPFLFARWGSVEGSIVQSGRSGIFDASTLEALKNNAGVFPIDDSSVNEFISEITVSAGNIDFLAAGCWCTQLEELFGWYSPKALLINSKFADPYLQKFSWTWTLKGKKVLVIHPFAPLIEKQYEKREKLFLSEDILPEFQLITYQAVQSMGGNSEFKSWMEALNKMKDDIRRIKFDVALIGCGAYGMPLGSYIKVSLHRQAIHIGGALQLLFGIKGKRWEEPGCEQKELFNEYWVRPTEELRPRNYLEVEGGCYW